MKYVFVSESIILLFAVFLLSITVTPGEAFAEDMLDNKMFVIKISEQGKEGESFDDELTFKEGTFFSSDCEQYGFGSAPYKATSEGKKTMFESTLVSENEGKALWNGTVDGDKISGTFVWSKEGQDPLNYSFEGSLRK